MLIPGFIFMDDFVAPCAITVMVPGVFLTKSSMMIAGLDETARISMSPIDSLRRRADPATVTRSTPGTAASRFSISRICGSISPVINREPELFANPIPFNIFSSLFFPNPSRTPIFPFFAATSRSLRFFTPSSLYNF